MDLVWGPISRPARAVSLDKSLCHFALLACGNTDLLLVSAQVHVNYSPAMAFDSGALPLQSRCAMDWLLFFLVSCRGRSKDWAKGSHKREQSEKSGVRARDPPTNTPVRASGFTEEQGCTGTFGQSAGTCPHMSRHHVQLRDSCKHLGAPGATCADPTWARHAVM